MCYSLLSVDLSFYFNLGLLRKAVCALGNGFSILMLVCELICVKIMQEATVTLKVDDAVSN